MVIPNYILMKLENDLVSMLLVDVDGRSLVPVIKKSKGKGGGGGVYGRAPIGNALMLK